MTLVVIESIKFTIGKKKFMPHVLISLSVIQLCVVTITKNKNVMILDHINISVV